MKKVFLVVIIALISFAPAKASHLMGGEITWECIKTGVNSGLYVFTLKVYRDCNGIAISGVTQTITVHNHPIIFSINVDLYQVMLNYIESVAVEKGNKFNFLIFLLYLYKFAFHNDR